MKRKPMKRGKELTRTPLARKTELKAKFAKLKTAPKYDPAERIARKVVRDRSMGFCEIDGNREATEWHHRMNRSAGGKWSAANGLHLCSEDHRMVTDTRSEWFDEGWCVKSWQNPSEVPVRLFDGWALLYDDGTVFRLTDAEREAMREEAA